MQSAQRTLDMTMYELTDARAERILVADAARGVNVRVILDQNLEKTRNSTAFDVLTAHGVHVVWAPAHYSATHQKTITVDNTTSAVMTLNLTSQYYSTSRDFAVIDRNPSDVAAIEDVFASDFEDDVPPSGPAGTDLVWSPGSETQLAKLISSAKTSVLFESEELANSAIVDALQADAARGVNVEITMTDNTKWHPAFTKIAAAGGHIHTYSPNASLYIHAKIVDVDNSTVFVGSENASTASLTRNRELGLTTTAPAVVNGVGSTFASDYHGGGAYRGA